MAPVQFYGTKLRAKCSRILFIWEAKCAKEINFFKTHGILAFLFLKKNPTSLFFWHENWGFPLF